ncbi:hypothetical protein ACGH52_01805 [Streptomyces sp. BBFR25]|nr:hypothetical protein [Streptomyces sp. E5N298]
MGSEPEAPAASHLDILTVLTVPQSYTADFSTGPDGRRLLIGGVESGVHA